jgi:LytS/YehU family sensor histidine kinase
VWRAIINWSYERFVEPEWPMEHWYEYFSGALSATYLFVCWMGVYFGFKYYESMQAQREAVLRASTLAQEAQLKMLRYQLNPHFLFNTLNAISTLILDNQNRTANHAVTRLSEFLRYTLDQDPMKKVTVAQELEALNLYLNIEKMRFGSRLTIRLDIAEPATVMLMPSLLLQPLLENAVGHGIETLPEGGTVSVRGRVEGSALVLEVSNPVAPGLRTSRRGNRMALDNIRQRLALAFPGQSSVDVLEGDVAYRVRLRFPLSLSRARSDEGP